MIIILIAFTCSGIMLYLFAPYISKKNGNIYKESRYKLRNHSLVTCLILLGITLFIRDETFQTIITSGVSFAEERFQAQIGDKLISENYKNILFFENASTLHKIVMHTFTRSVEFYGKIKNLSEEYPHFYRIHNSIVVNTENIVKINRKTREITMCNGAVCNIAVRRL